MNQKKKRKYVAGPEYHEIEKELIKKTHKVNCKK